MFSLLWTEEAKARYDELKAKAAASLASRKQKKKNKSTKDEGLFKQVHKTLTLLCANPRHPGLNTHEYYSLAHPYDDRQKVFEAYVQSKTPGAYRVFWCYGPGKKEITVIAITPHP
ncbi:MAG: hypothetical protein JXB10_18025 [Pirellulales bacterium]|nr:hypothetical protein [Pirellulales bacterium]